MDATFNRVLPLMAGANSPAAVAALLAAGAAPCETATTERTCRYHRTYE